MSLRTLPEIKAFTRPQGYSWDVPADVLARWSDTVMAAEAGDAHTITIYDVIGEDFWSGGGFTAKRMGAALRSIGHNDVTVKINSPGGDVFEGFTIYNQLREHPAKVTVDVMGIAASAASIIAMAGDVVRMGLGTFMMVHNAWGVVIGNRHDLTSAAELLGQIDSALVDIYEARTGLKRAEIEALLDAETFLGAKDSVNKGFADETIEIDKEGAQAMRRPETQARKRLDALLAQAGVPRVERRRLFEETGVRRDADPTATRDAGPDLAALRQLTQLIRS